METQFLWCTVHVIMTNRFSSYNRSTFSWPSKLTIHLQIDLLSIVFKPLLFIIRCYDMKWDSITLRFKFQNSYLLTVNLATCFQIGDDFSFSKWI